MQPENKENMQRALWYANVLQYFPRLNLDDLRAAFADWQQKKREYIRFYDACNLAVLKKGMPEKILDGEAGLLITFHTGPYRLLPRLLIAAGYKIGLVASSKVIAREKSWYAEELLANNISLDNFSCMEADKPTVLKQIITAIEAEKRWVLVFLDADEGQKKHSANLLHVKLFHGHVYFRNNLFLFAERFGIPVAIVYMEDRAQNGNWQVAIHNQFYPDAKSVKGHYAKQCADAIRTGFPAIIGRDWTAWENWSLLHCYQKEYIVPKQLDLTNPVWVMPFLVGNRRFFLDMSNRQFFEILSPL
ncbi:hypothetical protein [Sphingobacterium sp. LRF_L2]|uniref:hypothetical protein n=1 Tax=Sphingobacterium sp. LRF_L2 TaxID=3369421 RepID=UPI003F60A1C0